MLSLYIHVPFCDIKCKYCNFLTIQTKELQDKETIINNYASNIIKELIYRSAQREEKQEVKSIYFGGGTPTSLGKENMIKIIDTIKEYFDIEYLGELSIETNPYPQEEVYAIIKTINRKYNDFPRIRWSFGIQSFDNEILEATGRKNTFPGLVEFMRGLRGLKQPNNVFNFDFIAFGKFNTTKKGEEVLWNQHCINFFYEFATSGFADSFSLYTLELFEGSDWHHRIKNGKLKIENSNLGQRNALQNTGFNITDDSIYEEFDILKNLVLDAGYSRYELSNFAHLGKESIHNMVYRNMENYIGVGVGASSFIKSIPRPLVEKLGVKSENNLGIRRTNTSSLQTYQKEKYINQESLQLLTEKDYLIEQFFLSMRTKRGVENIDNFILVLIPDREQKIEAYQSSGYIEIYEKSIKLTDQGMDIYNEIITELLQEI